MIIKRTIGVSASKALSYDYGPGKAQEHHRPHRVAGTCRGTHWRARAAHMDAQLREHGDNRTGGKGRVIRLAVACAPEDPVLSDRQWARIAHQTVDGYTKGRADEFTWEAVRHDPRHIHVTLLQRDHDGRLLNLWQDGRRRMHLETQLEREHGLRGPVSERAKALDRSRSRDTVDQRTWRAAKDMQQQRGTLTQQQRRQRDQQQERVPKVTSEHGPVQIFTPPEGWSEMSKPRQLAWLRDNNRAEYDRRGRRGQERVEARLAERQRHQQSGLRPDGWEQMRLSEQSRWLRDNAPDEHQRRVQRGQQRLDDHQIARSRPRDYHMWDRERQQAWENAQRRKLRQQRERQAERKQQREREQERDGPGLER